MSADPPESLRWEVVRYQGPAESVGPLWLCRCRACGFLQVCNAWSLRRGRPKCERCKWAGKRDAAEHLREAAARAAESSLAREEEFLGARRAAEAMLARLDAAQADMERREASA